MDGAMRILHAVAASLAVTASLAVAGCNAPGGAGTQGASVGSAVGQNLVGEACHTMPQDDANADPGAPLPLSILCGTGKGLAGVIHASVLPLAVPASGPKRREAVERAAGVTPAALGIAARMNCRPGRWLPAQDGAGQDVGEVLIAPCSLNEGGWPQIVVTAPIGKILYQAEGLPSLMPVFLAAIGASAGQKLAIGEAATSIEKLETVLNSKLPSFGTGDLSEYDELIRSARVYNASRN